MLFAMQGKAAGKTADCLGILTKLTQDRAYTTLNLTFKGFIPQAQRMDLGAAQHREQWGSVATTIHGPGGMDRELNRFLQILGLSSSLQMLIGGKPFLRPRPWRVPMM